MSFLPVGGLHQDESFDEVRDFQTTKNVAPANALRRAAVLYIEWNPDDGLLVVDDMFT